MPALVENEVLAIEKHHRARGLIVDSWRNAKTNEDWAKAATRMFGAYMVSNIHLEKDLEFLNSIAWVRASMALNEELETLRDELIKKEPTS